MPAATIAISAAKGEAVTYPCTHVTSASSSTPIDISGWTIKVTARDSNGTVVLNKTASVTSGPAGTYSFAVTTADTKLTPYAYPLDIQRTDSGSEKLMGLGKWTITGDVLYL